MRSRTLAASSLIAFALATVVLWAAPQAGALALRGALALPGTAGAVALQGTRAYVAAGAAGLRIVDVSNANAPVEIGSAPTGFAAEGVAVVGSRAYVAATWGGLRIFDVSNPASPVELGAFVPGFNAVFRAVKVVGTIAYAAAELDGLEILDVSNPAAPVRLGRFPSTNFFDLALSGSVAYLSSQGGDAFAAIDVSNPTLPVLLATVLVPDAGHVTTRIGVAGTQLFLAESYGLRVYDVSVPSAPRAVSRLGSGPLYGANAVALFDGLVVAGSDSGVSVLDYADPLPEAPVAQLASAARPGLTGQVVGNIAYITRFTVSGQVDYDLAVVDVSNPLLPALLGTIATPDVATAVALSGPRAYVAARSAGVRIVDVSNPANPVEIGSFPTNHLATGVVAIGNFVYVADGLRGLLVENVASAAAPVPVASLALSGTTTDVQRGPGNLLVVSNSLGVVLVDVSNPASPAVRSQLPTPLSAGPVASAAGWTLYVSQDGRLAIYGIRNPAAPVLRGSVAIPSCTGYAPLVANEGSGARAYLCGYRFDVSRPTAPVPAGGRMGVLGRFGMPLAVRGGRLITADLGVFDVSAKGRGPVTLASVATAASVQHVALDPASGLVVVSQGASGIQLLDASAEIHPRPCANGIDDDFDGLVDSSDPGCSTPDDPSELPECADGIDNDGDGRVDHPADGGCKDAGPTSREGPQCNNGIDDNGDGRVDYPADPGCLVPWGDDESILAVGSAGCGLLGPEALMALALARAVRALRSRAA